MSSVTYRNERACGCICMIHARIDIHASAYMEERINDACLRTIRARVCVHMCARACACAHAYPRRKRASPSHRRWTACGSARRRSTKRRRLTRTSARGTPRLSRRWALYAPLPARRRATAADAIGRCSIRFGTLRGGAADARAHMRVRKYTYSLPWMSECVHSCSQGRWNPFTYV